MPPSFDAFDALVRSRAVTLVEELKELIRQPTVSAQEVGVDETARLVLDRTRRAGIDATAERIEGGPPTIIGETGPRASGPSAGSEQPGQRTLLVYDHYDVQPPDPLEEWTTPPFEPTERDGYLYGRGVSDNKGNLMARLQALEPTSTIDDYLDHIRAFGRFLHVFGGRSL